MLLTFTWAISSTFNVLVSHSIDEYPPTKTKRVITKVCNQEMQEISGNRVYNKVQTALPVHSRTGSAD